MVKKQAPDIQGNKLTFTVRNETEATALARKLKDPLKASFIKLGFPNWLKLKQPVKESKEEFQQFIEQKQQEDHTKNGCCFN
ncbi:hypothetical protein KHA80_19980 [Anaerobacillus sp. HL2]|nr:hypothetical protein KHA80_19980 [Anaerobacillus sp. HL2]